MGGFPPFRAVLADVWQMFACASTSVASVVYFSQVNIPPLPSGDWLRLRDGPSLLEELHDTTRTGDLASVGGTVWPAAATLCTWMRAHAEDVKGASVLELGSGTGACGLYAAALGASRVVLTDGREGLRPLQDDNIRRNAPLMRAGTRVTSETLAWGITPPPAGPWDLVIGSDLIYDSQVELAMTLGALLEATPPPTVLLAHEHRQRRYASDGSFDGRWDEDDDDLSGFIAAAHDERGLQLEQLAWELPKPAARMGGEREISIIRIGRPRSM